MQSMPKEDLAEKNVQDSTPREGTETISLAKNEIYTVLSESLGQDRPPIQSWGDTDRTMPKKMQSPTLGSQFPSGCLPQAQNRHCLPLT